MKRGILYTFVYILITIVSAIGTIAINALLPGSSSFGNSTEFSSIESTAGEKVLTNMLSMGPTAINADIILEENSNVKRNSILANNDATPIINDIRINFVGNINISNLDNIKMSGTLKVMLQDSDINLNIAFIENVLYVSNDTLSVKMEAISLTKIIDLLPLFGIDININLEDLSSLDIDAMMSSFANMQESTNDNGDKVMTLSLMEGVDIRFITDADYNVKGIMASRLELAGYILDMSTKLESVEVEIDTPEVENEQEFVDVTDTLNVLDSVSEIMSEEKLHLDLSTHFENNEDIVSISGDIDLDYSDRFEIYADLSITTKDATQNLKLGYIDSNIYVTLNNINLVLYEDTIDKTIDVVLENMDLSSIEQFILKRYIKKIPDVGLNVTPNIDIGGVDIDNLIEVSKGEDNIIKITLFGTAMNMENDIHVSIVLDDNKQFKEIILHDYEMFGSKTDAIVSYSNVVTIPELDNSIYYDMTDLPDFIDAMWNTIDTISNNKEISFVVNDKVIIKGLPVVLQGEVNVDFNNGYDVYVNLNATLLNKTFHIDMRYINDYVYLNIDGVKVCFKSSDIEDIATIIQNHVDDTLVTYTVGLVQEVISISDIMSNISINQPSIDEDMIKSLVVTNNTLEIAVGDVAISLGYTDKINDVTLNIPAISLDFTLDMTTGVEVSQLNELEYNSLTHLDSLVNAVLNTVDEVSEDNAISFDIDTAINYNGESVQVFGSVALSPEITYITLHTTLDRKYVVNMYIVEDTVYLDIDGLKIKTTIDGIYEIVDLFKGSISGEMLMIPTTIDINEIDLSGLDLSIFNNFAINENSAEFNIDTVVVALEYANTINSIIISNDKFAVRADIADIDIPTLNKESYSDISRLSNLILATKNTIDYVSSNQKLAVMINSDILQGVSVRGTVYVDMSNGTNINDIVMYSLLDITINNDIYTIEVRLDGGYAYIVYNGLRIRIAIDSVYDIADIVENLLPDNSMEDVDMSSIVDGIKDSIIKEVIMGNYSNVSLSIIKKIIMSSNGTYVTLSKDLFGLDKDFTVVMLYNDKITSIGLMNARLDGVNYNSNIAFNYSFTPSPIQKYKYYDISGIGNLTNSVLNTINAISNEKAITLNLNETTLYVENTVLKLSGTVYVDFSNAIIESKFDYKALFVYANLDVAINNSISIQDITIYMEAGRLYVSYDTLNISLDINEIDNLASLITEFQALHNKVNTVNPTDIPEINIADILNDMMSNIDFDVDISIKDMKFDIIKYLNIADNMTSIKLNQSNIELNINYTDYIDSIVFDMDNFYIDMGFIYGVDTYVIDYEKYSNLDSLDNALSSALVTATDVVDNEHIAFGLGAYITYTDIARNEGKVPVKETITNINLLDTSYAKFDWSNAYELDGNARVFDITKMSVYVVFNARVETIVYKYVDGIKDESSMTTTTRLHNIEITYLNNVVYVKFDKMKALIADTTINEIAFIISDMLGVSIDKESIEETSDDIESSVATFEPHIDMLESLIVSPTTMSILLNLPGTMFDLDMSYSENGLVSLDIENLNLANINVHSMVISLDTFTDIVAVEDTTDYIVLDGIEGLVEALKNTIEFQDYELSGDVKLGINILNINFDIHVDFKLKLTDNGPEAMITLGPIPVITGINDDVPWIVGNATNLTGNPGENRILTFYLKDNMVYIHRIETIPTMVVASRVYEKKTKVHIDTFMEDIMYYLLSYGMGFGDKIMSAINTSLNKERQNPLDYSNILLDYYIEDGFEKLVINLQELAEDEMLDTMTVGFKTGTYNSKSVIDTIFVKLVMPLTDSITITIDSSNLKFINRGQAIDYSNNMYPYIEANKRDKEGAEWDAYNGQWELASQRKFVLSFDTRSHLTVSSIEAPAGTRINLPELQGYYVDGDNERVYYEFDGWYDTITYDNKYTSNEMPRSSKTLYAKWITHVEKYITIHFEEMGGDDIADMRVLENSALSLPSFDGLRIVETADKIESLQFEYWYEIVDDEIVPFTREFAPSADITLYAMWKSVNVAETHEVSVYDNGSLVATKRFFKGNTISFTGAKFNATTKYLLDGVEFDMIMPDKDISIEIKNIYTITVKYKLMNPYRDAVDIVYSAYQGEAIRELPSQEDSYYDDGTETSRNVYDFKGWLYNGSTTAFTVVPNTNATIMANWEEDELFYYEVSFNVSWVKPGSWQDNNSSLLGKITKVKDATAPSNSFRVLERTIIDLSQYKAQCIYKYTGAWITKTYEFDVAYWSDQKSGQLYYNNGVFKNDDYTPNTPYEIKDDVTFYAVWKMYKDY